MHLTELNDRVALEEAAAYFLKFGLKNVVITLAETGAYFATSESIKGMMGAEKDVKVVDTAGAGDTFVGTYAVDYLQQKKEGESWGYNKGCQTGVSSFCQDD
ncbi:hypothetical protein B0T25DRAFT_569693 [Lasiosphaeria hispida]|uniref:Carbohydrate kinase PfkB domain-containing protein n=1 Tax=Lasiosphaeria hispida TaxID=260671 RepID=A0AAJ0HDU6_9PEZI|nr:hypothetical protein B0T25DRAFT_569693 [Lasiosphaeria hispida]